MASASRSALDGDVLVFEVATQSADALRARLTVAGTLNGQTAALLASALDAHLRTGRRYLRLDMSGAAAIDDDAFDVLLEAHSAAARLGGQLVVDNAAPELFARLAGQVFAVATPA